MLPHLEVVAPHFDDAAAHRVRPRNRAAFLTTLNELSTERRRWRMWLAGVRRQRRSRDFHKLFLAPFWLDHLRHHQRVTKADADVQSRVLAYHEGPEPPEARHWVAAHPADPSPPAELPDAPDRP
jgi:hypothetical protein